MARKEKGKSQKKQSSLKKTIISLILVIVLLGADYIVSMYSDGQDDTNPSIIEMILETINYEYVDTNNADTASNTDVALHQDSYEGSAANENIAYGDSKLEVYFFDVGQADSILLMTDGKSMLVDTGNSGDATLKKKVEDKINLTYELDRLGIEKIDILIGTHAHEDHLGSAYKIVKSFEIGDVYTNAHTAEALEKKYYERFALALEEKDVHMISPTTLSEEEIMAKVNEYNASLAEGEEKVVYNLADYIIVGDEIEFGDAKVTMLAPNSAEYSDVNDTSIVLMVEFEGVKLLLTGDAGVESEAEMLKFANETGFDLDCDILKVGHHGSRTANSEAFIAATKPEYAVIMVGEFSEYGLPDEDVIERLENNNATIYKTIDVGDIKLTIDDGKYEFDLTYAHEVKEKE